MNIKEKTFYYDSDTDDPYAGDHFRMYEFKIRRCTRSRSHDWTDCPFSHPSERALRRDPLRYRYTGELCPEFRHNGDCSGGEECGLSHGVFECWLHPSRYRTELCKDGKYCKRKVCFFAHFPRQLRVFPPEIFVAGGNSGYPATVFSGWDNQCCMFSQHSPTSTLLCFSRSPSLSPTLSPANKAAAFSRLCRLRTASVTYNEAINELISSLDSVSITESLTCVATAEMIDSSNFGSQSHRITPWIDAGNRDFQIKQSSLQFVLSPSTSSYLNNGQMQPSPTTSYFSDLPAAVRAKISYDVSYCGDPDVQWVNDLLT